MKSILKNIENDWPYFAGMTALLMLGAAHAFEEFGKLYPCILCLHQREVYWAALCVSVLAIIARHYIKNPSIERSFDAILAVIFLASAFVAGFHAGVEQHWWKGIAGCAGGGEIDPTASIIEALSKPQSAPSCDDISWQFIGLSMAGWNVVISLALALFSIRVAIKGNGGISIFSGQKEVAK